MLFRYSRLPKTSDIRRHNNPSIKLIDGRKNQLITSVRNGDAKTLIVNCGCHKEKNAHLMTRLEKPKTQHPKEGSR